MEISTSIAPSTPNKAESTSLKYVTREYSDASSEDAASSNSIPRFPTFHASALGPWQSLIAYEACARLCLRAWAMECIQAPMFLEHENSLLRDAFGSVNL
ncbi:hypothetical protein RYX36_016705 [Vicia faba]